MDGIENGKEELGQEERDWERMEGRKEGRKVGRKEARKKQLGEATKSHQVKKEGLRK